MRDLGDNKKALGMIAIFTVVIIWGCAFTVKPILLTQYDPLQIVFIQTFIAFILIGIYCLWKKHCFKIGRTLIVKIMLSGVLGITIYQFMLNYSIAAVGGTIASIFSGIIPAMCLIFDFCVFKRNIRRIEVLSIILSFLGILLISKISGELQLLPYIILFCSNIVWIFYCYFNNFPQEKVSNLILLFYQLLGCVLILTPYMALHTFSRAVFLDVKVFASAFFLSVVNGVFAYILFIYAIKTLNVLYTNIAINLTPVATIVASYFMFGETVTVVQILGTVLIIVAVVLPNITMQKAKEE